MPLTDEEKKVHCKQKVCYIYANKNLMLMVKNIKSLGSLSLHWKV